MSGFQVGKDLEAKGVTADKVEAIMRHMYVNATMADLGMQPPCQCVFCRLYRGVWVDPTKVRYATESVDQS